MMRRLTFGRSSELSQIERHQKVTNLMRGMSAAHAAIADMTGRPAILKPLTNVERLPSPNQTTLDPLVYVSRAAMQSSHVRIIESASIDEKAS